MKRVLAFLLMLLLAFAFVGCGGDNPPPPDTSDLSPAPAPSGVDISSVTAAIAATAPKSSVITTSINSEYGKLEGRFSVTYNADSSSVIAYSYEQFNEVNSDNAGQPMKETVSGTATVNANGTVSGGVGANVASLAKMALNLDVKNMTDEKIEGGVLSATVPKEFTASVFGVDLGADAILVITTSFGKVVSIAVSYTLPVGEAKISCVYNN